MSDGGSGSRKSKIMIVGEAPGAREDETHKHLLGQREHYLRNYFRKLGSHATSATSRTSQSVDPRKTGPRTQRTQDL
jgi:uracil-DNA glycosylase family 4